MRSSGYEEAVGGRWEGLDDLVDVCPTNYSGAI